MIKDINVDEPIKEFVRNQNDVEIDSHSVKVNFVIVQLND